MGYTDSLSNSLSVADVLKTTQTAVVEIHFTWFSCRAAHASFSSHETDIYTAVLT